MDMSKIPGTPGWIKSKGKNSGTTTAKTPEKVVVKEEGKTTPITVDVKNNNQ